MLEAQMAVFLGGIRSLRGNDIMNDCAPGPLQSQRLFEPFSSPSQP
jgi:hypothetical protein